MARLASSSTSISNLFAYPFHHCNLFNADCTSLIQHILKPRSIFTISSMYFCAVERWSTWGWVSRLATCLLHAQRAGHRYNISIYHHHTQGTGGLTRMTTYCVAYSNASFVLLTASDVVLDLGKWVSSGGGSSIVGALFHAATELDLYSRDSWSATCCDGWQTGRIAPGSDERPRLVILHIAVPVHKFYRSLQSA